MWGSLLGITRLHRERLNWPSGHLYLNSIFSTFCTPFGELDQFWPNSILKYAAFMSVILDLMSFCDILNAVPLATKLHDIYNNYMNHQIRNFWPLPNIELTYLMCKKMSIHSISIIEKLSYLPLFSGSFTHDAAKIVCPY